MAKILITGANGFMGRNLYNRLSVPGNEIIGIGSSENPNIAGINYKQADVRDRRLMRELVRGRDIVYHFAGQLGLTRSREDTQLTFDVNVEGTENILIACSEYRAALVFPSSAAVYGILQAESFSEDHPLNPRSPYGESKVEAEKLCMDYSARDGVEATILRFFNVYGPFQKQGKEGGIIPTFAGNILRGENPEIYGSGTRTGDFIYIDDALDVVALVLKNNLIGEPVNVGSGHETSINDLATTLLKLSGSGLEQIHIGPKSNMVPRSKADITKLKALEFEPKVSIEEGLARYWNWLRTNSLIYNN